MAESNRRIAHTPKHKILVQPEKVREIRDSDNSEDEQELYEIEDIVSVRYYGGEMQYYVKWKGYPTSENTWEPKSSLQNSREMLEEFLFRWTRKFGQGVFDYDERNESSRRRHRSGHAERHFDPDAPPRKMALRNEPSPSTSTTSDEEEEQEEGDARGGKGERYRRAQAVKKRLPEHKGPKCEASSSMKRMKNESGRSNAVNSSSRSKLEATAILGVNKNAANEFLYLVRSVDEHGTEVADMRSSEWVVNNVPHLAIKYYESKVSFL